MEFYDAINSRRTIRDFEDSPVDTETVKRVLKAGLKAPTNDHMRNWEFVVVTDKQIIASIIKKIPKKTSEKRVEFILNSWRMRDEVQRKMYLDAIPKQYKMLYKSGCLILPFFKQTAPLLEPKTLSSLNGFASIWCCIENILLAAAAERLAAAIRIPLGDEPRHIAEIIRHPANYVLPCYIAIGHPAADTPDIVQNPCDLETKLHINQW